MPASSNWSRTNHKGVWRRRIHAPCGCRPTPSSQPAMARIRCVSPFIIAAELFIQLASRWAGPEDCTSHSAARRPSQGGASMARAVHGEVAVLAVATKGNWSPGRSHHALWKPAVELLRSGPSSTGWNGRGHPPGLAVHPFKFRALERCVDSLTTCGLLTKGTHFEFGQIFRPCSYVRFALPFLLDAWWRLAPCGVQRRG